MKKQTILWMALVFLIASLFVSCIGNSEKSANDHTSPENISSDKNGLFGDFPEITENYTAKIKKKEQQIKDNTDLDKAFKLSKELDVLKEERFRTMKNYLLDRSKPLSVPITQEGCQELFKISSITLKEVTGTKSPIVKVTTEVEILKAQSRNMIYIQMLSGNNPTGKWILLNPPASISGSVQLKPGTFYQFTGSLPPQYMNGVTQLVVKTKEEYHAAKK